MFRYRKWVLTLGILAVAPGITLAGPFSLLKRKPAKASIGDRENRTNQFSNQKVAENIAEALRNASFDRHDIGIEFQRGVATFSGAVATAKQKADISQIARNIPGVDRVNNQLRVNSPSRLGGLFEKSPVRQAATESARFGPPAIRQTSLDDFNATESAENNQKTAEKIAKALSSAGLSGYDIEIRYQNGVVQLAGNVSSPQQWQNVMQVVSQVSGVRGVDSQITIQGQPVPRGPVSPAGYQPAPGQPAPGQPAPGQPAPGQPAPGQSGPQGFGHPGQGAAQTVYNMPHLPDYAWPAMASYPNSAQISYPQQYSASAWPYIGPFYPYPQVPLGWRKAQLEWDDGQWVLKFQPRTDKWFWFLNPGNW
jgi:osmotically-inducible protein OsmY